MMWDVNNFATLSRMREGGTITLGDDSEGKKFNFDNVKIGASLLIKNVAHVNGLKYNLLSISQFCD